VIVSDIRRTNTKRTADEIEDESGLNLDTYKFPKRDRSMQNNAKMDDFVIKHCVPMMEDEEEFVKLSAMEQFFIKEFINEQKKPICNYRWMLRDNLDTYYSSKSEISEFFECRPFKVLFKDFDIGEVIAERGKTRLLEAALNHFFCAVHSSEDVVIEADEEQADEEHESESVSY